jgi:hypothetical protein
MHYKVSASVLADLKRTAKLLGLKEWEATETALREWVQHNRDEAQKRLDMYAEKGVVINLPEMVQINVAVFQKAEVMVAKEELQRLLSILPDVKDPASRRETQLELAKTLKVIQPVFVKTRDPELAELLKQAEQALQQ